ncbi:MAG TPA: hypothetical protein VE715_14955 [Blastocatellia bacterium]|nr:hypothetical protein [Blastocatellia bacterium]
MNHSLRDLLLGLIDYAGLFPPAALDMPTATRKYAEYRESEYRWALGRFVVPVARLDEFEKAAEGILPDGGWEGDDVWRLSALGGDDLSSDLHRIAEFNKKRATPDSHAGAAVIDTIEIKAGRPSDIENAMKLMPAKLAPYFEIPIGDDPTELIKSVAETEARAKVRTGGVTADAFPSSFDLARFIKICAEEDLPFKATAGLHHPLRSVNKLTYAPDSASTMMHGFLNVFLAAAFAQNGMDVNRLVELLEEKSPEAFQFDSGCVTWRDEMIVRGQLRNSRNLLAIAFGSCSFEEPIEDLKKIGLL